MDTTEIGNTENVNHQVFLKLKTANRCECLVAIWVQKVKKNVVLFP